MNEREIFLAVIEITDPAERAAWLDQACGDNHELRSCVDALLTASAQASQFLEQPAVEIPDGVDRTLLSDAGDLDDDVAAATSGEAEFRRYLQPSGRPGSLGRLGHYEIEQILGRGAFGIVAKAIDEKLRRVVAIKLMNPELATTSPPRKRFLREAHTTAAVTHENIVAIYAVEEEPLPYLVMEYIPGQTLQQRMDAQGPLAMQDILRIGQQVAAGLASAHAVNLIHRDIKPSNILLTDNPGERAKITDFGLARAVDDASLTSSGVIAGTPLYMAPEQARGEPLDHRADLFSLGCVLYQMASGRPPFRAANTVAVLKRVCEDTPRPLNDVIPDFPAWLEAIILRLLQKDREDRFQSAQEVADLLARCQNGQLPPELPGAAAAMASGMSAPESPEATSGGSAAKTAPSSQKGVLAGIAMTLIGLVLATVVAPRIAQWLKTPIPKLPDAADRGGLWFDGRDDWVQVSGLDWDYPQFTIEAFVTSAPQSDNGTIAFLGSEQGEDREWMSLFDGNQAGDGKRVSGAAIQGKEGYENAYGPFGGGERQHRALVYDGRTLNYYINGVWQGQRWSEAHEGMQWSMTELRLGCDGGGRRFFQGTIDLLRISRVARYSESFTPIASLSADDRTLAIYQFDEGAGTVLHDSSGHGHDGTIQGARWKSPQPDSASTEPAGN
ncbi:MAG: protein kinase [Planctomycetaceae bacterium]|nr:protein kinase [Planctomycetaceae bacterium]